MIIEIDGNQLRIVSCFSSTLPSLHSVEEERPLSASFLRFCRKYDICEISGCPLWLLHNNSPLNGKGYVLKNGRELILKNEDMIGYE